LIGDYAIEHHFILKINATIDAVAELAALHARGDEKIVVNLAVARAYVTWSPPIKMGTS